MPAEAYEIPFLKMEGCGNDYVFIDLGLLPEGSRREVEARSPEIAVRVSERHFGIGADGLVLLSEEEDGGSMVMYNADGSPGRICGNALRCVALLLARKRGSKELRIRTSAGSRVARVPDPSKDSARVEVDMGEPCFEPEALPLRLDLLPEDWILEEPRKDLPVRLGFDLLGKRVEALALSMGNPHLVVFLEGNPDRIDLRHWGSGLETLPMFPDRTNVELVRPGEDGFLHQRTWERGSGETLACGSGACAVAVASVSRGLFRRNEAVPIRLKGGELEAEWRREGGVLLRGPAREVFRGSFSLAR